jgi:hypothetical protein
MPHPAHDFRHTDDQFNRLDSAGNVWLPLQLEHISTKVNLAKYPDLTYAQAFDIVADPPPWFDTSYALVDQNRSGDPKLLGTDWADQGPRVQIDRSKSTSPLLPLTDHYDFTVADLARAQNLNVPLTTAKAMAARRTIEEGIDFRAWLGDSRNGIPGLLSNLGGIAVSTVAPNGTTGHPQWSTKTFLEIIADIQVLFTAIESVTLGIPSLRPNRLGLCTGMMGILALKPNTLGTNTVMDFVMASLKALNPDFQIVESYQLNDVGGNAGMCMYRKDADCVGHIFSRGYTEDPPMLHNRVTVINCSAVTGGLEIRQPKSIGWMYGIR